MASTDTNTVSSFGDLIQSKLFTFKVGKERKEFVVHSGPVAAISAPLNTLINGHFSEAQTGDVPFDDIEPADFARFLEYAYRYNYTSPAWVVDDKVTVAAAATGSKEGKTLQKPSSLPMRAQNSVPQVQRLQVQRPQAVFGGTTQGFGATTQSPPPVTMRSRLLDRVYLSNAEPNACMLRGFKHQSNTAPEQNFTPVFLAHARLYTFACERLIDPLKRLALSKLHETLLDFTLYQQRLIDVVELVRYAYDNGEDRKDDGTVDKLRKLVTEYVGIQISVFKNDEEFTRLLEEGREFVVDLVRVIDGDELR